MTAQEIARMTNIIIPSERSTWITIYYSFKEKDLSTTPAAGYFKVTDLIRPNTAKDIERAVERFKRI